MKKIALLFIFSIAFSCSKKESVSTENKIDSTKVIDSINTERTKINDSIRNKNRFDLLSGNHTLTHGMINKPGTVVFEKVKGNGDEYTVKGEVQSGKNYFKINGIALRMSPKFFNFTGSVTQSIQENDNGKVDSKKLTKSFMTKDGGKTWKMQGMINSSGFADDIYIKTK